jgi:HK97 gp10 family phage protein
MGKWQQDYASMAIFRADLNKELSDRLEDAGAYAETAVKLALSMPGGGKLYGSHRASAPGQAPTTWSGDLRASITHIVTKLGLFLTAVVGSDKDHAPLLEFGTSKMAPRPFMRVTIAKIQPILWRIMAGGKSK